MLRENKWKGGDPEAALYSRHRILLGGDRGSEVRDNERRGYTSTRSLWPGGRVVYGRLSVLGVVWMYTFVGNSVVGCEYLYTFLVLSASRFCILLIFLFLFLLGYLSIYTCLYIAVSVYSCIFLCVSLSRLSIFPSLVCVSLLVSVFSTFSLSLFR